MVDGLPHQAGQSAHPGPEAYALLHVRAKADRDGLPTVTPASPDLPAPAVDAAHRLWAGVAGEATAPDQVAAGVERLFARLRAGLGRWVGAEGYCALLDRAVALVRTDHPVVDGLSCRKADDPVTPAVVRAHGTAEVTAGTVALLAALIDLLGRIVGEEIAVRLVEQTGTPTPGEAMRSGTEGGHDG